MLRIKQRVKRYKCLISVKYGFYKRISLQEAEKYEPSRY